MEYLLVPDFLFGDDLEEANIFFYLRESGPDQIKLKLHYSQNMLCFMLRGVKEIIDGASHYQMNNEQIGLVTSGSMLMTERVSLRNDFESLLLFFSNQFLSDFLVKYELKIDNQQIDHRSVITFSKDEYLINFQQSMRLLQHDFKKKHFRLTKMEEILLYLIEKYPDQIMGFIANTINKTQNSVAQIVQSHKYKNLNTEELAFLCNMSLSTFKRKFQNIFNTSPKKYMLAEKMKKAEQLLLQQRKRPSDIYHEIGYETLSSFSQQFKKHFGFSPKSYQHSKLS